VNFAQKGCEPFARVPGLRLPARFSRSAKKLTICQLWGSALALFPLNESFPRAGVLPAKHAIRYQAAGARFKGQVQNLDLESVPSSVGTSLSPYGIAYRMTYVFFQVLARQRVFPDFQRMCL